MYLSPSTNDRRSRRGAQNGQRRSPVAALVQRVRGVNRGRDGRRQENTPVRPMASPTVHFVLSSRSVGMCVRLHNTSEIQRLQEQVQHWKGLYENSNSENEN